MRQEKQEPDLAVADEGDNPGTLQRLSLGGMTCDGCTDEIECELKAMSGVLEARASYERELIELILDARLVSLCVIEDRLIEMGYTPRPYVAGQPHAHVDHGARPHPEPRMGLVAQLEPHPLHLADAAPVEAHDSHQAHGHHHHGLACVHPPYQRHPGGSGRWVAMLGTISGIVCLIHCLATPVLLGLVAILPGVGLVHGPLERFLVVITLFMAWLSVGAAFRVHRRRAPAVLLFAGSVIAAVSLWIGEGDIFRTMIGLSGTALLVASIWVNRAFVRRSTLPMNLEPLPGGVHL